jgi:serine protease
MKKSLFLSLLSFLLIASCSKQKEETLPDSSQPKPVLKQKSEIVSKPTGEPFSKNRIDQVVKETISKRNDFHWEWMDLTFLWSAIQYGDHAVAIGYKPTGMADVNEQLHTINIKKPEWKAVHDALIEQILIILNKTANQPLKAADIIVEDDPILPVITFRITDPEAITFLYNLENVRYIEPMDYWPTEAERSSSGCDGSSDPLFTQDYTTLVPGCKLPWNYTNVSIPTAWNVSQGQGITIGIIDAGISSSQTLLGSQFNQGYSNNGRTISTDYTYGSGAFTSCAHGTSMSGLAAGPRNSLHATTGVAYKANLHFIRACEDVVLNTSSERTAVKNALVRMGNKANLKIISMSIGTPFSSSLLLDGVNYAYGMGKLIFAAAGTSYGLTSWWGVIYPAAYPNCLAVTGVDENSETCSNCHDGNSVHFTIPMERSSNADRNTLSLAPIGVSPTYVGGSSSATAMSAGIAALVWSAKPTLSRQQVLAALRNTAQYYPAFKSNTGYGNLNAAAAVNYALVN